VSKIAIMLMLREYHDVSQVEGETTRRWFSDEYFDLIVWLDGNKIISGFQLCYDITRQHRAVTWRKEKGFTHHRVDDGENRPGKIKSSPILIADGIFEYRAIAERFRRESAHIEPQLAAFVYKTLMQYPGNGEELEP